RPYRGIGFDRALANHRRPAAFTSSWRAHWRTRATTSSTRPTPSPRDGPSITSASRSTISMPSPVLFPGSRRHRIRGGELRGVVKNDAEREALAIAQAANTMAHRRAVETARSFHRPLVDGEDHRVALGQRHDLAARLHARPL